MSVKASKIFNCIEEIAPISLAESWDNVGLQIGSYHQQVDRIMTTLDVTDEVISEAIDKKIDLIISHHPFFFNGVKRICLEDSRGKAINTLLTHQISVYSAHTNMDIAEKGINDLIARRLGLTDIRPLEEINRDSDAIGKKGCLPGKMSSDDFIKSVKDQLAVSQLRMAGERPAFVKRVALCTGSGASFMDIAKQKKADVYITGDLKYHDAQRAKENGIWIIDAGHYDTEKFVSGLFKDILENTFSADELTLIESESGQDFFQYIS